MTYTEIQNELIAKYNVTIVDKSTCWARTHAHCFDGTRRICKWNRAESYASLFTLCHEIGHLETTLKGMLRCEEESLATKWGIAKIKEYGLPIKRRYLNEYKRYIKRAYDRGVRRGMKRRVKSGLLI